MGEEEVERTRLAALLHDVGKIGVPDSILFKAQPLDAGELEVMRAHAEAGATIASRAAILAETVAAIEAHHERWDGRRDGPTPGYPRGLRGDQIPMAARIIAVADAYDAMTTAQPSRAAMPPERALAVLKEERGAQFDPRVVDAFLDDVTARRHRRASGIFRIPSLTRGSSER
jgi:HD-GYP domain-containing protein (c-di-GMP phosphodiesterase class II)